MRYRRLPYTELRRLADTRLPTHVIKSASPRDESADGRVRCGIDRKSQRELRERYEVYWSAFAGQIRTVRNDAGHPVSIDPVTADTVHASLLIFPELAGLASALWNWVSDEMK